MNHLSDKLLDITYRTLIWNNYYTLTREIEAETRHTIHFNNDIFWSYGVTR